MKKRRSSRIYERLSPCQCCKHPISQRHHLWPVNRHGEAGPVRHLCANCHEAFHVFEAGQIDQRAGRKNTHAMQVWAELYFGWGGKDDPRVQYINELVAHAEAMRVAIIPINDRRKPMKEADRQTIRRGDLVRVSDGKIVRVVSTASGYIHTTAGTYGPWQVTRIGKDDA